MEIIEIKQTKKKIIASESLLEDSTFTQVCLNRLVMDDIAMTDAKIINANLTNLEIEGAQLGGAYFHNIGMPPEGHPNYDATKKHRSVKFEDCNLSNSTITECNLSAVTIDNCNLSNISITDCNLTGMTINGILVSDLLKAYKK